MVVVFHKTQNKQKKYRGLVPFSSSSNNSIVVVIGGGVKTHFQKKKKKLYKLCRAIIDYYYRN